MKWLCAGVAFVTFSTVCGLLLGIIGGGLNLLIAAVSLMFGLAIAGNVIASDAGTDDSLDSNNHAAGVDRRSALAKYRHFWKWAVAACFAIFAVRSFGWLLYIDGEELRVQSPNNLGDLALHITFIRNFANGVALWPENPIYVFSHLRYPAGMDLFNSLFAAVHVDLARSLVWTSLLASVATFYAFYRWGGSFAVAGFLFNGGVIGLQRFLHNGKFADYQGDKTIAWKSIPLSMFVTQRSVLYAIPVGLLLLWHWREKYFRNAGQDRHRGPLPFWLELSFYASMPLFHVHTFLALTIVLVCLFAFGDFQRRRQLVTLVASAFVPATFFVWLITDHFHAASVFEWHLGWLQTDDDFARPFFQFWFVNFGFFIPLALTLIGFCSWEAWKNRGRENVPEEIAFLSSAVVIFAAVFFFKTAPWGWDNIKLLMWAYFLVLPFLWTHLIADWPILVRTTACIGLFGSGFVTLFGGLAAGKPGYGFANRAEVDGVGAAVERLPIEARFAAYPTYNHPLLLQGRKLVLGYPGHLWTEGFDYSEAEKWLRQLMQGASDWREKARTLRVRYVFWGREEKANYPGSKRPWERASVRIAAGDWGAIYDLSQAPQPARPP
jgi:hypothetical protein